MFLCSFHQLNMSIIIPISSIVLLTSQFSPLAGQTGADLEACAGDVWHGMVTGHCQLQSCSGRV